MSEPVTTKAPGRRRIYLLVRMLYEGGVIITLALVLGLLKVFELPQSNSISLGMLSLLFSCVRWGMGGGFIACFAFGVFQVFIQGAVSWDWQSILLDYVLAFGVIGIAGLGRGRPRGIFWGSVLGGAARFVVHYISGITIYKILTSAEIFGTVFDNPTLYSLIYNGSYVGIGLVLCLVTSGILYTPLKKYMMGADLRRQGVDQLGKFNGVPLASDFDDTLYGEDIHITRENVGALTYSTQEGGTFTVTTGHTRPGFTPHTSHIPIDAPVILSSGSALYDFRTGEMIYETFLPDQVRESFQQVARAIPIIGFGAYHHDTIYVYRPNTVTLRHLEWAGITARRVPIVDVPLSWSRVIPQQGYEALLHTQHCLLGWRGEHYEVVFSSRVLLELTRKGSSEGDMVQYLTCRLSIDTRHVYCVENDQNDILMLAVSATPLAPANYAPEVKQQGARILGTYEENCMMQIVDILDHIYA